MFYINNKEIKPDHESFGGNKEMKVLQLYNSFIQIFGKHFVKKAKLLTSQKEKTIETNDHPILYVAQREFATVSKSDDIKIIGTDMMTTCHCVIITSSHLTALGHFDGSGTFRGICDLLSTFQNHTKSENPQTANENIKLHMIGGFLDDRETSVALTMEILETFALLCSTNGMNIHLETFACSTFNTCHVKKRSRTLITSPIVYGVALSMETGEIFPAVFTEAAKQPVQLLRGAYSLYGAGRMRSIYNNEKKYIEIKAFSFGDISSIPEILVQSDNWILQNLSTSPDVEPDNFVMNIRQSLKFIHNNYDPTKNIFKNNKSLKFHFVSGSWIPVEED